jgi:hypothetical protein
MKGAGASAGMAEDPTSRIGNGFGRGAAAIAALGVPRHQSMDCDSLCGTRVRRHAGEASPRLARRPIHNRH